MKALLTTLPLAAMIAVAPAMEAQAASCSSAAAVTSKLWTKYGDVLTKLGCTVAAAASQGAVDAVTCVQQIGKYDESVQKMITYYNQMAESSWATIGPRRWDLDKSHTGRILGTTGRMFVMPAPVADHNFYVRLEKTAGKGKASVTVCRVAPDGSKTKVWDFVVPAGKDNIGKQWTKRLPETKGYIYTAHIDGKSLSNTFSYELKTF